LWWKFSSGGSGVHLIRVTHVGTDQQEVWIDGSPVQAPPGTTTFTGPAATLLELMHTDSGWILTVDGNAAESYNPDIGPVDNPAVAWWKFTVAGLGVHHLRVTDIGTPAQAVFLDGAPLDAPPGTMTFTGPAASLLELQHRDIGWVLSVDGKAVHQHNPNVDIRDPLHVWNFTVGGAMHEVRVANIGAEAQEIHLDGEMVPAPPGTVMFTGPGAALLQLQQDGPGGAWTLLVDGEPALEAAAATGAGGGEAAWTFLSPACGDMSHQMRVLNIGGSGQQVYIDGSLLDAPPGSTTFTGPGGLLLELRRQGHAWALFLDGLNLEDHNAAASGRPPTGTATSGAPLPPPPSAASAALPQGVSWDPEEGAYKANLRMGGKFRCLGSFATAEEAHARYMQAKAEAGS